MQNYYVKFSTLCFSTVCSSRIPSFPQEYLYVFSIFLDSAFTLGRFICMT